MDAPALTGQYGMAFCMVSFVAAGGAEDEGDADGDVCFLAKEHQEAGKAIVDCGATRSIGGVTALESLGRLLGPEQISIDFTQRPWFTFGNGSRQRTMSRASFQVTAGLHTGKVNIYVLDAPNTPILLSIEALEGLGAIIDFTTKTAVLQKIDPRIVIRLEQSEGKHLLLNMSKDLLQNGVLRSRFGSPWSSICEGNPDQEG